SKDTGRRSERKAAVIDSFLESFHFVYLLGISAAILIVFAVLGMARYSAVWYLALSAPAAFFWPLQAIVIILLEWPSWQTGLLVFLLSIPLFMLACPLYWVGPIVFVRQCLDLKRGKLAFMNSESTAICVGLGTLYLWCDLVLAFFSAFAH